MAPHPTHRLSAWLVPSEPERLVPDDLRQGLAVLQTELGAGDPRWGRSLLPGGWVRAHLDHPPQPHLYGNKQGGYRVRCPVCQAPLAREAAAALVHWRAGQGREVACRGCGARPPLEGLDYRPPAAPARFAIELRDVDGLALTHAGTACFRGLLCGEFQVIGSRG